jgi:hypothetical protein
LLLSKSPVTVFDGWKGSLDCLGLIFISDKSDELVLWGRFVEESKLVPFKLELQCCYEGPQMGTFM